MGWYDAFSLFYDASLERLYRPFRVAMIERLALTPGMRVLDAGCGTGQSLEQLARAVGPEGEVVGVDLSTGMLAAARRRIDRSGLANIRLIEGSLLELDTDAVGRDFDRALCFLVLSAMGEWERATTQVWERLAPGGMFVIVDVHTERLGLQGRLVNLTARADIRRRVWSVLESVAASFTLERLGAPYSVGGDIVIASGRKPG